MQLYFDNIIFSLQKAGGISVVWHEHLKRALLDPELNPLFFENFNQNIFRKTISIPDEQVISNPLKKIPMVLQRYLNPKITKGKGIFHSSYYRTVTNPNFINVTTVHDFTYEYFRSGLPKIIHAKQKGNAIHNSKRTICISESTKSDLLKFYPKYPESQISVIYNGVNEAYSPLKNKKQSQLNKLVPFDSLGYILYVGDRKTPYKNFNMVVESAKIMKLPLVLAGGGNYAKNEKQTIESRLGSNSFILVSGISNSDLNILFNHAMCLVYPSLYEGFGIPIIEAQKAGCPVICSNSSSLPEVAGNGAYLVADISVNRLMERINQLKHGSGEREQLIDLGFKNAVRFSWDKCYQQTKQVYKEVYEEYF
jgi:mannosyltransferase